MCLVTNSYSCVLPLSYLLPLFTHHSIEEWCLGDCALGEGMYQQCVTNGNYLPAGRWKQIIHATFFLHLLSVLLSVGDILNKRTHRASDLSCIQPLINPAFPCRRSSEVDVGGQSEASVLPIVMKPFYYCGCGEIKHQAVQKWHRFGVFVNGLFCLIHLMVHSAWCSAI